jgi:hypothetical protein
LVEAWSLNQKKARLEAALITQLCLLTNYFINMIAKCKVSRNEEAVVKVWSKRKQYFGMMFVTMRTCSSRCCKLWVLQTMWDSLFTAEVVGLLLIGIKTNLNILKTTVGYLKDRTICGSPI